MPLLKPTRGTRLDKSHPLGGSVCFWPLNEGAGDMVFDFSRNGNNGIKDSGIVWISGKFGSALDFGNTNYIETSLNGVPDYPFTLVASGIHGGGATTGTLLSIGDIGHYGTHYGICIINYDTGYDLLRLTARFNGGTAYSIDSGSFAPGYKRFQVVGVFASATDRKLYVNGVLAGSGVDSVGFGANRAVIGAYADSSPSAFWSGPLDYAAIYPRDLSAVDIARLYQKPFCMFEVSASPKVAITVPAVAARHAVGFRPIEGAERLRGLRRSAFY